MKIFKNPELKNELMLLSALTLIFAAGAALFAGKYAVLFVLGLGGAADLAVVHCSRRRYARIEQLSSSIDRILHDSSRALDYDNEEGELAILVSEVQKMTVRLREQNDLLKADKIRLTNAIADIFHQMRTPLTSMNLEVSLLGEETIEYGRRIELVRDLKKQLERMSWLTESLLKMSRIDAGTAVFDPSDCLVLDLINKACEPFLVSMELRDQSLEIDCADEHLFADPAWLTEALSNLVKNCMEHTPDGGRIIIKAKETALFTEISVEDNGGGFVQEDLPYIFERFYKGKNATAESIGIGLALSRAIVSAQNGTLSASNTGQGAKFVCKIYKSVV